MPILKRQVDSSPSFVFPFSFMKDNSSVYTLLAQTIYTLLKRSPLKWKHLRLSSPQVTNFQISYLSFEKQVGSTPSFVSLFSFMKDYFAHKEPVDSAPSFAYLFSFMNDYSPVLF